MPTAAEVLLASWLSGWTPDPRLTVSSWSAARRVLDSKSSAEAGSWLNERTPYLVEIMDALSVHSPYREVIFMKGSQIGGSEAGYNWIGYIIEHAPAPTLCVLPSVDMARVISQQRIAPMIAACPTLAARVSEERSRSAANSTFAKMFPGGVLFLTGANSSKGLRSRPVRNLFCDEVDDYPGDVDNQGDPIALAQKRQSNFAGRKAFFASTPTTRGVSNIERLFLLSDQRRYFVPCPHCGHFDWIRWENIRWERDPDRPETARLMCVACEKLIEEGFKTQMLAGGQWRPTAPANQRVRPDVAGFHLSGLYSPLGWRSWAECVEEFLRAKGDPFALKVFVNTVLGETFEQRAVSAEPGSVLARAEAYPDGVDVPHGVGVLVASVDVQDNRLEVKVKGFGAGEESWLIAHEQIFEDPGKLTAWDLLDATLRTKYRHASGREVGISSVAIDSGGHFTEQVYRFCAARLRRRIFPIRGGKEIGKPLVGKPTFSNRYRVPLFTLCVNTGKEIVFSRLRIEKPDAASGPRPGYMHFPLWIGAEYAAQLTAERAVWKHFKGRPSKQVWIQTRERNEALDLEVYALAALYVLGSAFRRSLPERAARLSRPHSPAPSGAPLRPPAAGVRGNAPPRPVAPRLPELPPLAPRPSGWLDGFR